jgi:hypothetical protein
MVKLHVTCGERFKKMAVITWLDVLLEDGQKQKATFTLRIAPLAFAAAQTLPTPTEINAVIDSLFGTADLPSDAHVTGYQVRVEQNAPESTGGDGISSISSTIRTRNALGAIPGNFLVTIPGLNKAAVSFDPVNPNSISTVGTMWDAYRTAATAAHIAISDPVGAYVALSADEVAEVATAFDGRRAAPRPR